MLVRRVFIVLVLGGLFCWVFGQVLFSDRNLVYRDAGHFYYPLFRLVQQQWSAGLWPLWNPYENGGTPLLANPAASVLYPPRVVLFQWLPLPFAAAYKCYILLHVLMAVGAAYVLARHWSASDFGSAAAGLCYGFGAVVMFQYCNVIFLVGAAWVPLGLLAADRAVRDGDWRWGIALGLVLALQALGGDPEAAYVTGLLAALYASLLDPAWGIGLGGLLAVVAAMLGRPVAVLILAGVLAAAPWLVRSSCWSGVSPRLRRRRSFALLVAAVVAAGLAAVQVLPAWEFSQLSVRAAPESNHNPYVFWVGPWRLPELLWPNIYGHQFPQNSRWVDLLAMPERVWEPSLYMGSLTLLLALGRWSVSSGAAWRRWMSVTLGLSLLASLGPAGGPTWYARTLPQLLRARWAPNAGRQAEPAGGQGDTRSVTRPEYEEQLSDPPGGLYWLMVQVLPGFGTFRYPAKLLTFAAIAVAMLAAAGWDRLASGPERSLRWLLAAVAGVSVAGCVAVCLFRSHFLDWVSSSPLSERFPYYGPLLPHRAFRCLVAALTQTAVVTGTVLLLSRWLSGQLARTWSQAGLLLLVAADLGLANRWLVATARQSVLDSRPRVAELIERDAASNDFPGPFRVHRVSIWEPQRLAVASSARRTEEVLRWERDTVQPKYGILYGLQYTINEGTMEPYDYWFFFAPFYRTPPHEWRRQSAAAGRPLPERVVYYPRRGYDLWGARYFVVPAAMDPAVEHRGALSFLLPPVEELARSPADQDDYQVLRNESAYPRAWLVHRVRVIRPIRGLRRGDREEAMELLLYQGDELWRDPLKEPQKMDPRREALVEAAGAERQQVLRYSGTTADSSERCRVVRYEPLRVEVEVQARSPGILVLADLFYPGWRVAVDGRPGRIWRVNRMMRGVGLEAGRHRVVFTYWPASFRIGAAVSLSTAALLGTLGLVLLVRRLSRPVTGSSAALGGGRP